MTSRSILLTFEQYQRARLAFAQQVAELACRPQHSEILDKAGVLSTYSNLIFYYVIIKRYFISLIDLLRPLLTDPCQQIQQCAAIALGRLVHNNSALADVILGQNFLPILLGTIHTGNVIPIFNLSNMRK